MISSRFPSRIVRLLEHSLLTTDLARALRSSLAFTAAWVVCLGMGHPMICAGGIAIQLCGQPDGADHHGD
jgi:hypothetical protein